MGIREWFSGRGAAQMDAAVADVQARFDVEIDPSLFGLPSFTTTPTLAPRMSRQIAIQVPAVKRAHDLIAGTLGTLPVELIGPDLKRANSELFRQPERDVPRSVTFTRLFADLFFEGIAWWRVTELNSYGYPARVVRLDPRSVNVREEGRVYVTRAGNSGVTEEFVPDPELIRFDSPTVGLLKSGARAIRAAALLDAAAERMADGAPPLDYFTPAEGADPANDEDVIEILNEWQTARQTRSTGYVPAALKYNLAGWNPEQLQLAEARQHAVLEIARLAGVDAEELGVSTTSRTYSNQFDRRKQFTDFTLGLYRQAVEDRLSMGDITPPGFAAQFNLASFLRSDDKTRYESYQLGLAVGALDQSEIRALESKPPIDAPAALPAPADLFKASADNVIRATFDADAPIQFDIVGAAATEVDMEARTIKGLAVPYNVPGTSFGRTWVFSQGSLTWDNDPSRVKLWVRHNPADAVGYATALDDRPDGLYATFQVDSSPEGTKALQKAKDKVNDGLSIGLHPNGLTGSGKYRERDGIFYSVAMPLMETSLTPAPIFANARVHAVAASATTTGEMMNKEQRERLAALRAKTAVFSTDEQGEFDQLVALEAANPTANPANFSATSDGTADAPVAGADFSAMTDALTAAISGLGPREVVAAGGGTAQFAVTEPSPYQFDGLRHEHDFSTDLIASIKFGDGAAAQRIDEHMQAAAPQFAISVGSLNPNQQRPDLYVDQKDYSTPVWDAINKGGLTDGTPFVLPKFSSSSGLVSDHSTGVEPSSGSFATTSQTVTPKAQSGRVDIPREVWDQGGSPQLSGLLWNQIMRAWSESLEAYAVATLDAASPTGITVTAGAVDKALDASITSKLAALQYIRGGFRMRDFFLQVDLFQALVGAVDDDGRHLFPMIGAQNANGTVDPLFAKLNVGGLMAKPAWALAATGTAPASSYLFDRADVSGWATAPQRIVMDQISVANVSLGVWGYAAAAITDLTGVREVIYDPVA